MALSDLCSEPAPLLTCNNGCYGFFPEQLAASNMFMYGGDEVREGSIEQLLEGTK